MVDLDKAIKGLEETETMLIQAVDRGGEMAVMGAFKCLNRVTDALVLLKKQEKVEPLHKCIGKHYTLIKDSGFNYCPYCGKPVVDTEGR